MTANYILLLETYTGESQNDVKSAPLGVAMGNIGAGIGTGLLLGIVIDLLYFEKDAKDGASLDNQTENTKD